jgi:hypothetical protein
MAQGDWDDDTLAPACNSRRIKSSKGNEKYDSDVFESIQ